MNNQERLLRRLHKLAKKAVYGGGVRPYVRWSAERLTMRDFVGPVEGVMLKALLDGTVDPDSYNPERQLIHHARMQLADMALRMTREDERHWKAMRRLAEDAILRSRNVIGGAEREPRAIKRLLKQLVVWEMFSTCTEEAFTVIASFFQAGNQRGAAEVLSAMLGRNVSLSEYNRTLRKVRQELIEWLDGEPPRDGIGRWPSGRGQRWRDQCGEVASVLTDIARERKLRESQTTNS
jgi:hypothetical protein